jgi:hypothetical protein
MDILRWLDAQDGSPSTQEIMRHFGWSYAQLEHELAPLVEHRWLEGTSRLFRRQREFRITYKGRRLAARSDQPASGDLEP